MTPAPRSTPSLTSFTARMGKKGDTMSRKRMPSSRVAPTGFSRKAPTRRERSSTYSTASAAEMLRPMAMPARPPALTRGILPAPMF